MRGGVPDERPPQHLQRLGRLVEDREVGQRLHGPAGAEGGHGGHLGQDVGWGGGGGGDGGGRVQGGGGGGGGGGGALGVARGQKQLVALIHS